mgnify:CR=1
MNKHPNRNNSNSNWYTSYYSHSNGSRANSNSSNHPSNRANHTNGSSHSSGSSSETDYSPIKLIKERFNEDPLTFVAEVAVVVSLFALLYAGLWLGSILGLS